MKPRVYVETSIISYLAARPSRDVVLAGRQQATLEWWRQRRDRYQLFISEMVIDEAARGDQAAAAARLELVSELPRLLATDEVTIIAEQLLGPGLFPRRAAEDAVHLAFATAHHMDFLLTWNFRHLANAQLARAAYNLLRSRAIQPPLICTPDELEGLSHAL